MTDEANALPAPVEPEVLYQSWDPPSGPPMLYIQFMDASDGWTFVNVAMVRGGNAKPGDEFRRMSWFDSEESRRHTKVKAYKIASDLGVRTRVIRQNAPV